MKGNKEFFIALGVLIAVIATCSWQESQFFAKGTQSHPQVQVASLMNPEK